MAIKQVWLTLASLALGAWAAAANGQSTVRPYIYDTHTGAVAQAMGPVGRDPYNVAFGSYELVSTLTHPEPATLDYFGGNWGVALDGEFAFVGAGLDDVMGVPDAGSVHVYGYDGGDWVLRQTLTAPTPSYLGHFGVFVAVDGPTLAVGEPGYGTGQNAVHIFRLGPTGWVWEARLSQGYFEFGYGLDVEGDALVAMDRWMGAAWVFDRQAAGTWVQRGDILQGSTPFGNYAAAIEGDTVALGSIYGGDPVAGFVDIFRWDGTTWVKETTLAHPEDSKDFGHDLDLQGDQLIVGSRGDDRMAYRGSVFLYERSGSTWSLVQTIVPDDAVSGTQFGGAVDLEGTTLVVGAPGSNQGYSPWNGVPTFPGRVYLYALEGGTWVQRARIDSPDDEAGATGNHADCFGGSVALDDGRLLVGASGADVGMVVDAGKAYLYHYHEVGFDGFFDPVDNPPVANVVKAGSTVPLKWRLTDASGNPITDLTAVTVMARTRPCALGETDDLPEEYAAGASGLQNLGDGYYQFNWKTPKSYARSCKTLHLDLGEGLTHTALFTFER